VQRQAHDRGLDYLARVQRRLELGRREAVEPGGQRDVGRRRVLALQRGQPLDRLGRVEPPAFEQQLTCG